MSPYFIVDIALPSVYKHALRLSQNFFFRGFFRFARRQGLICWGCLAMSSTNSEKRMFLFPSSGSSRHLYRFLLSLCINMDSFVVCWYLFVFPSFFFSMASFVWNATDDTRLARYIVAQKSCITVTTVLPEKFSS